MTPIPSTPGNRAIAIAGTGSMAQALGALLRRGGYPLAAIGGRRPETALRAAAFTGAAAGVLIDELPDHAQRILIAVADDAIGEVAGVLASAGLNDGVVLHVSGAAGPEALAELRKAGNAVGVLHPLQTVPTRERGVAALPGSAFAYAGDEAATDWAQELILAIGGTPLAVDPQHWSAYHAAAVMACNYHVTLVDASLELMDRAGIARDAALKALAPLIRATTENILRCGPEAALTGPIRRGDTATLQRHLAALGTASPDTRDLYMIAGRRTLSVAARAGLASDRVSEVASVLERSNL